MCLDLDVILLRLVFYGKWIDNRWNDNDNNSDNKCEDDLTLGPEGGLSCFNWCFLFSFSIILVHRDKLLLLLFVVYFHHIELIIIYQLIAIILIVFFFFAGYMHA